MTAGTWGEARVHLGIQAVQSAELLARGWRFEAHDQVGHDVWPRHLTDGDEGDARWRCGTIGVVRGFIKRHSQRHMRAMVERRLPSTLHASVARAASLRRLMTVSSQSS